MTTTSVTSTQRPILILVTVAFSVLTGLALWHHGFVGIFQFQMDTWAGRQVLVDLVIACGIILVWLWRDAKALGRNPWPWIILTAVAGSFGPLLYLITRKTP